MILAALLGAATPNVIEIGPFSRHPDGFPPGWVPLTFPKIARHTTYRVVDEGGTPVVLAESEQSSSALMRETDIDVARYPVLHWSWKIERLIARSDMRERSGDDYPARIYLVFDKEPSTLPFSQRVLYRIATVLYGELPTRALTYVWATATPKGEIYPSPYTDFARLVVAESGPEQVGRWTSVSRNVAEDYARAFGEPAPPLIGVAVMTDSDDTGETARAFYGDIWVSAPEQPR